MSGQEGTDQMERIYESIDDLLMHDPNPLNTILSDEYDSQRLILERLGLKDAKLNFMEESKEIYDTKKGCIIDKIEYGCILTENGFYNPDERNSNLEGMIAKGCQTIGLLFISADKKLVNCLLNQGD